MKNYFIKYSIVFLLLIFLQLFLFNQVIVKIGNWFFVPYVYILALLLLPFDVKDEYLILSAFFIGLVIDIFSGTVALNAAASVIAAYMRKYILAWISPRMGYMQGTLPSYLFYGYGWFIKYALFFTFIHHLWFYLLDVFSFRLIGIVLVKALINTLISVIFILLLHFLFKNRPTII